MITKRNIPTTEYSIKHDSSNCETAEGSPSPPTCCTECGLHWWGGSLVSQTSKIGRQSVSERKGWNKFFGLSWPKGERERSGHARYVSCLGDALSTVRQPCFQGYHMHSLELYFLCVAWYHTTSFLEGVQASFNSAKIAYNWFNSFASQKNFSFLSYTLTVTG